MAPPHCILSNAILSTHFSSIVLSPYSLYFAVFCITRLNDLACCRPVSLFLVFCCFQQVSDMHSHLLRCLHLDLSEIKSYNCPWPLPSIISCNNSILFLPWLALPNIFPSITSWSKFSCQRTCPSHLCFLCQIIFSIVLASLAGTKTYPTVAGLVVTMEMNWTFRQNIQPTVTSNKPELIVDCQPPAPDHRWLVSCFATHYYNETATNT